MAGMRRIGLACAIGIAALSPNAHAEPLEVAHDVRVDFGERAATLTVRRSVKGDTYDPFEAHMKVRTAGPVVATALRTRGVDGRWYGGTLQPVEQAIATYWQLTGSRKVAPDRALARQFAGTDRPRDPALLMWSPEGFDLYAFPVTIDQPRTVEYTLVAGYDYIDGAYTVRVPVEAEPALAPRVTIGSIPAGFQALAGARALATGSVIAELPGAAQADDLELRLVPATTRPLTVRLMATPAGTRSLIRAEVEVGTLLGPDPTNTHAVVVVDRSRSMEPDHQNAARRAGLAYLEQLARVAGARAEVVLFDRTASARFGKFVAPAEAAAALQEPMTLSNGSALVLALQATHERLKTAPAKAPRRVLVLSDTFVDPDHEAGLLAQLTALRKLGAVVHVADMMADQRAGLAVVDNHRLHGPVRATGGETWSGSFDVESGQGGDAFAEWVRPRRVHDLRLDIDGFELDWALGLAAGDGTQEVDLRAVAPRHARARGWLWGTQLTVTVSREARTDRAWSVLAAAYIDDRLTAAEIEDLAVRAGAVSPETALLALEPHVKPGQALTAKDPGPRPRSSNCMIGGGQHYAWIGLQFDEPQFIRDAVAAARHACHADGRALEVEITTTYREVVAIPRVTVAADEQAAGCVTQQLWALEFPQGKFHTVQHAVQLPAK